MLPRGCGKVEMRGFVNCSCDYGNRPLIIPVWIFGRVAEPSHWSRTVSRKYQCMQGINPNFKYFQSHKMDNFMTILSIEMKDKTRSRCNDFDLI